MATIVLTDIADGRVIQRDSSDEGSLLITGTYTGTVTSVEARVVDDGTSNEAVTWTTIDSSPAGGTFSGTLSNIPQGGWYNVDVRVGNEPATTDEGTNAWGVGIIVATSGQSNMAYWFDRGTDTANSLVKATSDGTTWAAPTTTGACGFGNKLATALSIPIGLLDTAVGGSALNSAAAGAAGYWLNFASDPYDNFNDVINSVGDEVEYVLWNQGERDARNPATPITEAQHESDMSSLWTRMKTDITFPRGAKMIIGTLGRCTSLGNGDDDTWQGIRNAQEDFAADNADVYVGAQTIDLDLDGVGVVHLSDAAYGTFGERMAHYVLYLLGEESYGIGPDCLYFTEVDSSTIDIHIIHRGGSDFTPTSSITGFKVYDSGTPEAISSISRQNANTIRISLTGSIAGTPTVTYLYGADPTITGDVFDNTAMALPLMDNRGLVNSSATTTSSSTSTSTSTSVSTSSTSSSVSTSSTSSSTSLSTSTSSSISTSSTSSSISTSLSSSTSSTSISTSSTSTSTTTLPGGWIGYRRGIITRRTFTYLS